MSYRKSRSDLAFHPTQTLQLIHQEADGGSHFLKDAYLVRLLHLNLHAQLLVAFYRDLVPLYEHASLLLGSGPVPANSPHWAL